MRLKKQAGKKVFKERCEQKRVTILGVSWCCIIVDLMRVSRQDDDPDLVLMPGRSLILHHTIFGLGCFHRRSRACPPFSTSPPPFHAVL